MNVFIFKNAINKSASDLAKATVDGKEVRYKRAQQD